jgi:hypothetical protein
MEGVVVMACNGVGGSHDVALHVGDGQDVGRSGPFGPLLGHRFATFLVEDQMQVGQSSRKLRRGCVN